MSAGAGGSSIIKVADNKITIGPESVGAVPGPACFGRGGKQATITDASLLCGLFDPASYFGGGMSLDIARATDAVMTNIAQPLGISLDQALLQMESAYEEKIARELHHFTKISPKTVLLAFGGAGPLNACGVADKSGIRRVAIPHMAAVFSAYGIGSCDISQRYEVVLPARTTDALTAALTALNEKAARDMFAEGVKAGEYELEARLVAVTADGNEIVHVLQNPPIFPPELLSSASVELEFKAIKSLRKAADKPAFAPVLQAAVSRTSRKVLSRSGVRIDVPVYRLADLRTGDSATGPAIIEEDYFTCRVLDGWRFAISDAGDIMLNRVG